MPEFSLSIHSSVRHASAKSDAASARGRRRAASTALIFALTALSIAECVVQASSPASGARAAQHHTQLADVVAAGHRPVTSALAEAHAHEFDHRQRPRVDGAPSATLAAGQHPQTIMRREARTPGDDRHRGRGEQDSALGRGTGAAAPPLEPLIRRQHEAPSVSLNSQQLAGQAPTRKGSEASAVHPIFRSGRRGVRKASRRAAGRSGRRARGGPTQPPPRSGVLARRPREAKKAALIDHLEQSETPMHESTRLDRAAQAPA
eukprot:CAMPEP_0170245522 /NCGR_PEP_ID=MMETSP0116_2-20130129/22546_1 /TAXON_ID=400756 /ORGANISM="Durinskia baltica, Strain CSIRO CS-38" /LENGTH=261 /DNA_ID=CAMNT_0010496395 /DNA_START=83 /DNA_END=865 /DNA_ORIENTATION=-